MSKSGIINSNIFLRNYIAFAESHGGKLDFTVSYLFLEVKNLEFDDGIRALKDKPSSFFLYKKFFKACLYPLLSQKSEIKITRPRLFAKTANFFENSAKSVPPSGEILCKKSKIENILFLPRTKG